MVKCTQARDVGPQDITACGEFVAVLNPHADYERLAQLKPRFAEFMQCTPLMAVFWATHAQF